MTGIWMLLLGLAGVSAVLLFMSALKRWPVITAISIAVNVLIAWEIPYPPALVNVGGASVYFLDILAIGALATAMASFPAMMRNLGVAFWPWIGFGILLCVSLALGLAQNPFGTTMNEFRTFFYVYASMTWAMSLVWNVDLEKIILQRFSLVLGWSLTVVSGYHFAIYGLGSTSEFVDAGTGLEQTTRTLVSGQSLMILLCGIFCMWSWRRLGNRSLLVSSLTFFVMVIISQQRTVWAVGIASLIVVFLAARASIKARVAVFSLVAIWILALVILSGSMPQILSQLASAATDSGTYDARVRSWTNLIAQSELNGPLDVIFGQPMGIGYGRFEGAGRWVVFAPHNWYVTTYLRTGVAGLSLLLIFVAIVLVRLLRGRTNMAAIAIVIAVTVYGWSYSWPWYLGLFYGWAVVKTTSRIDPPSQGSRETPASFSTRGSELKQMERQ